MALAAKRLELGFLASLANDPGEFRKPLTHCVMVTVSLSQAYQALASTSVLQLADVCLCNAGLNPLVPYLSNMLAEQVKKSLKSVKSLQLVLKVHSIS